MSAIRLARAATGRKIIVKFEGCYHGHADGLLVKAGSGVATFGIPGSAGVPEEIAHLTHALPYNDLAAVEAAFDAHPDAIAAVILEPVVGNAGCIPPAPGYLARPARAHPPRRRAAHRRRSHDRLPRRARRRTASSTRSTPTSSRSAKSSAEACPSASSAASANSWIMLAPLGPVYQAGTLSGNPLAMAAGIATVSLSAGARRRGLPAARSHSQGRRRRRSRRSRPRRRSAHPQPRRLHVDLVLHSRPRHQLRRGRQSRHRRLRPLPPRHARRGVWLPPSQFEAAFISTAHGEKEIQETIAAARAAFESVTE